MSKLRITESLSQELMEAALIEARKAALVEEVPVGAVVYYQDRIIARAHNLVEIQKDSSAHAEILAIKMAAEVLGDWRLNQCILAVTLEPCTMCLGAIKLARIPNLIIGLMDPVRGACGSLFDLSKDTRLGPEIELITNIYAGKSEDILKRFFQSKRSQSKN